MSIWAHWAGEMWNCPEIKFGKFPIAVPAKVKCYNRSIIGHDEDEIVLFCPHCGEEQEEALEELDFNE